ncbi:MAG: tetratricopeptide repeat protein, partial [Bacteroidota bacterium]
MKIRTQLISFFCFMFGSFALFAQSDPYEVQRSTTERLRKENKYDSMLVEAGKLRSWTILNEKDTSLRHPLSLRILGQAYEYKQKADSAIKNYTMALEILKKQKRYEHIEFARTLHTLGSYQNVLGRYAESEKTFLEVVDLYKKMKMENSLDFAKSMNNMGMLYDKIGNRSKAEMAYKQSLEIKKTILGDQNPDYARSLENLGLVYSGYDDFKAAKPYLEEALQIRKSALGENHPDYARSLYNLGLFYLNQGDFQTATPLMKQSLEIRKTIFGENHLDYIRNLVGMGMLYTEYEDYKEAGDCFRKTTELYKKTLGDQHIDYARSLANLAAIHKKMGDYVTAEKLNLQAIAVKKKALGENDKTYLLNLANLANIYMNTRQFKKADSLYHLALNAQRKVFGETNMGYISTAMNLGWLNIYKGNYAIADSFLLGTLNQIKTITGVKNNDYALNLGLLGKLNARRLEFALAESYYLESIGVYNELYGTETKSAASMKAELAMLYVRMGREKEAFDIMTGVMKSKTNQISDNFEWLNDNQKEAYWKQEIEFFDQLSWFANQSCLKVPEALGLNYNASLLTKSKMLEAKISTENFYREVDEIREELAYRRRLLAKMESDGSTEKDKLEKLRIEADSLDKRLTLSWPEYAQQKKNLSITWDQVQQNLDKGEAAIEFVRFKNEDDSVVYYNALVLKKGDKNPTLVKLCKEKDLQSISPKMSYSAYYPLVWLPLEATLKDVKTIYYAPTGELYNVPFHAIYAPKGKGDEVLAAKTDKRGVIIQNERAATEQNAEYLMDRYTMHQLTSTRYLAMGIKQKAKEPI